MSSYLNACLQVCSPCSQLGCTPLSNQQAKLPIIDTTRILTWMNQANRKMLHFDALNANGLYSLLNKEVTVITDLLREANELTASIQEATSQVTCSIFMRVIQPKKERLEQQLLIAQQTLAAHQEEIRSDQKLSEKWAELGLDHSVLERHADCARFMVNSGLAFSIVGFRESSDDADLHDLKLDTDSHPLIKVAGRWIRWENFKKELVFDQATNQIRSRGYEGQVVQGWTYLSPEGLQPIDRMNHDQMVPIHRLNPEEYQRTLELANRFYETNPEVDQGIPKDCILQFVTTHRRRVCGMLDVGDETAWDNLIDHSPGHMTMRLIKPTGELYSFGFEVTPESLAFIGSHFLGTVIAKVNKAGDYEEFRSYQRRVVTGIPLTSARANGIIKMLNEIGDVRFQFMRQNCSTLARLMMKEAGYTPIDNRIPGCELILASLPPLKSLPLIEGIIEKIQMYIKPILTLIIKAIPEGVKKGFYLLKWVVFYIPNKVSVFAVNLLQLYLGGGKMLYPLSEGVEEDEFFDNYEIINFSRGIRSFWDLFKDETSMIYHSKLMTDWQMQQRSTFTQEYTGQPKLAVVPPVDA